MSLDNIHLLNGQIMALEEVFKALGRMKAGTFEETSRLIDMAQGHIEMAVEQLIEAMAEEDHVV